MANNILYFSIIPTDIRFLFANYISLGTYLRLHNVSTDLLEKITGHWDDKGIVRRFELKYGCRFIFERDAPKPGIQWYLYKIFDWYSSPSTNYPSNSYERAWVKRRGTIMNDRELVDLHVEIIAETEKLINDNKSKDKQHYKFINTITWTIEHFLVAHNVYEAVYKLSKIVPLNKLFNNDMIVRGIHNFYDRSRAISSIIHCANNITKIINYRLIKI